MNTLCRGLVVMAMAVMVLAALVSAQITFSRDWTGGKRAGPPVALDCGQFTRLCRRFVHELKAAISEEMNGSPERQRHGDEGLPVYEDE